MLLAEVPLARHRREVAGVAEDFGDRHRSGQEPAANPFRVRLDPIIEPAHSGLVRIEARQQRRPRGAAPRRVISLREANTPSGEPVEIRRRNLAAVRADVGEAQVVDQHDDDVGPIVRDGRQRGAEAPDQERRAEPWSISSSKHLVESSRGGLAARVDYLDQAALRPASERSARNRDHRSPQRPMSPVREHTAMVNHAKALDRSHRRRRFSRSLIGYTGSIPPTGASFTSGRASLTPRSRTIQAASDFVVAIDRINAARTALGLRFPRGFRAHHADSQGTIPNSGRQLSKVSPNLPCP